MDDYVAVYNEDPEPFIWTKSAGAILQSMRGCYTGITETGL